MIDFAEFTGQKKKKGQNRRATKEQAHMKFCRD